MKITKLQQAKKNVERVNIYLDETYWTSVTKQQVIELGLFKGMEINDPEKEKIEQAHIDGKLLDKVKNFIQIRPRSVLEVRKYLLYRRNVDADIAEDMITTLVNHKYLNDEKFAEWYINQRIDHGLHGPNKVKAELYKKGVTSKVVNSKIRELMSGEEYNEKITPRINEFIQKEKSKIKEEDEFKVKQKLLRKLAGRGFGYEFLNIFNNYWK